MSSPAPYELAFQLHGHASDVRNLAAPSPEVPLLLSGSRDGSALLWGPGKGREWDVKLRVEAPEKKYVSCVGMTKWQGEALLLVGSSSGILTTYTLPSGSSAPPPEGQTQEPLHTLFEHKQNLCCLDTSKNGLIATGSWDQTAIVWKDFKKFIKIEGHEQAIWAVKFIGEDRLLTASADKTIVLHQFDVAKGTSTPLQTYTGHTEPVRGLSLTPDKKGFWSCGNDSLVNVYSLDNPSPIRSLSGHTSFVYSVTAFPDGSGAISSGEDGTLRVWSQTELVQTIAHSCNSIWSSAVVPGLAGPSAYIASSGNDATIRFFTRDIGLKAPEAEREAWDKQVSSRALDKSQIGDVKQSDLPGPEALGREGKKDGQVIMIKNNGQVEAYQWQSSGSTWQQIGQVVDAIGSGRKQLYAGKEYDYVFDVDVSEDMPPLKLPYNISENPWVAAQRFLEKHELPTSYADQVVDFIGKNTNGATLGEGAESSTYVDPYTGASRYTGASGQSSGASAGGSDPFTGGGAYTGSNAASSAPAKSTNVLPVKQYLSFKQINLQAVKTKATQFAEEIKTATPGLALTDDDEKNLEEIYTLLASPSIAHTHTSQERYDPVQFCLLFQKWPEEKRFPLLDLARILATLSPSFGAACTPDALLTACDWSLPYSSTKAKDTNTLLALRTFANLFLTSTGRKTMTGMKVDEWLKALRKERSWEEIGARKLPFTTVALNFSILAVHDEFSNEHIDALSSLIIFILQNEKSDSETIYRASIAFGNLLCSPSVSSSLHSGDVKKGKELIAEHSLALKEKRLTDLLNEIKALKQG